MPRSFVAAIVVITLVGCSSDASDEREREDAQLLGELTQPIIGANTISTLQANAVYLGTYGSGTLVSPRWVVTSAHQLDSPVVEVNPWLVEVKFGSTGTVVRRATQIWIHPNFVNDPVLGPRKDVALIRLDDAFTIQGSQQAKVELTYRRDGAFTQTPKPVVRCLGYGEFAPGGSWGALRYMDNVASDVDALFGWMRFVENPIGRYWGQGDLGGGCVMLAPQKDLVSVMSDADSPTAMIGTTADAFRTMFDRVTDGHEIRSDDSANCLAVSPPGIVPPRPWSQSGSCTGGWRIARQKGHAGFQIRRVHGNEDIMSRCLAVGPGGTTAFGFCDLMEGYWEPIIVQTHPGEAPSVNLQNLVSGDCLAISSANAAATMTPCTNTSPAFVRVKVTRAAAFDELTSFRQTIMANTASGPRCLGFASTPGSPSARMVVQACASELDNFVYSAPAGGPSNYEVVSPSTAPTLCIHPENHATIPGTRIVASACGAPSQKLQRWGIEDRVFRFAHSQQCLSVPSYPAIGDPVTIQPCEAPGYQQNFTPY